MDSDNPNSGDGPGSQEPTSSVGESAKKEPGTIGGRLVDFFGNFTAQSADQKTDGAGLTGVGLVKRKAKAAMRRLHAQRVRAIVSLRDKPPCAAIHVAAQVWCGG